MKRRLIKKVMKHLSDWENQVYQKIQPAIPVSHTEEDWERFSIHILNVILTTKILWWGYKHNIEQHNIFRSHIEWANRYEKGPAEKIDNLIGSVEIYFTNHTDIIDDDEYNEYDMVRDIFGD